MWGRERSGRARSACPPGSCSSSRAGRGRCGGDPGGGGATTTTGGRRCRRGFPVRWPCSRPGALRAAWAASGRPAPEADEARVELARRWRHGFGPATVADLKWWSGLTLTQVRKALAALPVEEVDLHGVPGVALADADPADRSPEPWIALLPSL